MKFQEEVSKFRQVNGNKDYTQRDMLMFLCNRSETQANDILGIKTNLSALKEKSKWLRGTDAVYFTFFCGILYLILNLHSIL